MVYFNDQLKNNSYADKWKCKLPTTPNLIREFTNKENTQYIITFHIQVSIVYMDTVMFFEKKIQDSLANDNKFEPIYNPPTTDAITCLNESSFCQDLDRKFHLIMI